MTQLLYSSGLRLMECLRLRVKDVDFEQHQILVRDPKGMHDRTTMLPVTLELSLQAQLQAVKHLHERVLAEAAFYRFGSGTVRKLGRDRR